MIEAFDGGTAPLTGLWIGIAAAGLLAVCLGWRLTGRRLPWFVPIAIVVVGLFGGAAPVWDQLRIRSMLASGKDLHVTRGAITQTWHIADRRRDQGSSRSNAYKTVVSEGFDVGMVRFSWVVGGCLSGASLCELARSRVPLERGTPVEVTWFADAAQQDERRIVRLLASRARLPR